MTRSILKAASATRLLAQPGHSHNLVGELAQPGHLRSPVAARPWSLARPVRDHSANMGPCDASQPTLTRLPTRPCGHTFNRPGLPLPAHYASWICQPFFRLDRPWVPPLQRLLPVRRHAALSSYVVLHAVSHLAVPRLRGFEPVSGRNLRPVWQASRFVGRLHLAVQRHAADGCVHNRQRYSHLGLVAPLLVVIPLRG